MADSSEFGFSQRRSRQFSSRDSWAGSTSRRTTDWPYIGSRPDDSVASASSSSNTDSTSLESFVRTLQRTRLYGPISLIDSPQKIGQGGQFYVYKQEAGFPFPGEFRTFVTAVKRPIFPDREKKIDLGKGYLRTNLHHAHQEIKALTHEGLRDHPNIVKLLAWSVDSQNWKYPLGIVFELASSDLAKFLQQEEGDGISCLTKCLLSDDVAKGLDAIHNAGFVHGDLKPENVLLFWENDRHVGKLSDFGFATMEGDGNTGGTPDWQPPEGGSSQQGDRFTYGLLLWRVFMHAGTAPQRLSRKIVRELALADLAEHSAALGETIFDTLRKALENLLEEDQSSRPPHLHGLLQDAIPQPKDESPTSPNETTPHMFRFRAPLFSWEVLPHSRILLLSLYGQFKEARREASHIPPLDLFAMAIAFSDLPPSGSKSEECVLPLLDSAARGGINPARALMPRAAAFYGQQLPAEISGQCMMSGVCTGSTYSKLDLESHDKKALADGIKTFHEQGGYVLMYWDLRNPPPKPMVPPCSQQHMIRYNTLHWLAAFGDPEALESYLLTGPVDGIDSMTVKQETPLYLACARGSWPQAALLLRHGADASISCTPFRISCLHWAFAFDQNLQGEAVHELIKAGGNIDALVPAELPFFHYPFKLPAGTPLHWAIATASHGTVRVLIELGADPLIRNGSDPYMYDDRIRSLYAVGGPDEEAMTFEEPGCEGLSPLDLAAIQRDPCVFEAMLDAKRTVDVNASDEEGFTVLHRLSHEQVFRTSTQVTYSPFPFGTGKSSEDLISMVSLIVNLGGDINRLTSVAVPEGIKQQRKSWQVPSYTPLMLAMLQSDYELVKALVTCGADVQSQNVWNETALLCLSHRAAFQEKALPSLSCVQLLVSRGADVNHQSSDGNCALVKAAQHSLLDVFEFLLSEGADVDTRKPGEPGKVHTDLNVFGILARQSHSPQYKETVLQLLKEYLFSCNDREKKRRALEVGDVHGVTLLHQFSAAIMPSCVEALLRNGAPVNALSSQSRSIHPIGPDGQSKRVWNETPLDMANRTREFRERHMHRFKSHSRENFSALEENIDKVIDILETYGGVSAGKDARAIPVEES